MADPGRDNYNDYIKGKDELKFAALPFKDDKLFAYIKKNTRRAIWVLPIEQWRDYQKRLKKNIT
jgi:hypothetical protein